MSDAVKVKKTRGEKICDWIEANLFIPDGKHVGKPFILAPHQRKAVLLIYDNPAGTSRAIISWPRKAAKTTITAALMLVRLVGPDAQRNAHLFATARTRDQAALLYDYAVKMCLYSPTIRPYVKFRETKKEIICEELGNVFKVLASDAKNNLGASVNWCCHDELGAVAGPSDALFDAMDTASTSHDNPLTIIISTQARSDNSLLSMLIDHAKSGVDPKYVVDIYAAPQDAPLSMETVAATHPAWGYFVNEETIASKLQEAISLPSQENSFRNFYLNQRIASHAPFISKSIWEANGNKPAEIKQNTKLYLGLDLSKTGDTTSIVAAYIDEDTGDTINVKSWFWLPAHNIIEKSQKDKTPWDVWAKKGFITLIPGKTIDTDHIAKFIMDLDKTANIESIGYDPYNFKELKNSLDRLGVSEKWIERKFVQIRQGFTTISPMIKTIENKLTNEIIAHGNNPLLTMNVNNAVVIEDSSGNRKLVKASESQKIDGAIALIMAVQEFEDKSAKPSKKTMAQAGKMIFL